MRRSLSLCLCLPLFLSVVGAWAQNSPSFNTGEDPKPASNQWQLVEELSDEFDGDSLNLNKWRNTDPSRWIGRSPGIFKKNTVSLNEGNMRITNYQLATPETHNGKEFTHAGGHVISEARAQVGYYFEARIKANKTFMSSTFWLINYQNEGSGCDRRTTELDIQECVGQLTNTANWAKDFDQSMHSNTHSRNITCNEASGSRGDNTLTGGKVWADYHTYGAWWKSPTEVQFFLDGEFLYSVTPYADFDLPMYLKLVTETYDWNPVPADGGMNGTWTERTTFYDWVRTWKLDTPTGCIDEVSFNPPSSIAAQTSYTIEVAYTACESRDIILEFWNDKWLGAATTTVSAGTGTVLLTIDLPTAPQAQSNYLWKTSIRPVGTDWQSNLDTDQKNDVVVTSGQLIVDGRYVIKNKANHQYLAVPMWIDTEHAYTTITASVDTDIEQRWDFTYLGEDVYQIKLACCARYLEVPYAACVDGSDVSTWSAVSASHQQWQLSKVGDYYMLHPDHCLMQAMVLNPNSGTPQTQGNDNVYSWTAISTSDNQLWEIIPNKNARFLAPEVPQSLWTSILPNPVSQSDLNITFEYTPEEEVIIRLFDMQGKQLYLDSYNETLSGLATVQIPQNKIQQLAAGMYVLELRTPAISERVKFWVK